MADDFLFWFFWAGSTGLCLLNLLDGWRNPAKMLTWPFLSSLICLYFYGYMAASAFLQLNYAFKTSDAIIGQLLVLCCLIGINVGWKAGMCSVVDTKPQQNYSLRKVWVIGICLMLLATSVHFSFHGFALKSRAGLNFRDNSAYWYMFFWVGYPGLSMAIWAMCKMNRMERRPLFAISIMVFFAFIFPHVVMARRGPLFPAVIIFLFIPSITLRKKPNPVVLTTGLIVAGLAMLTFVQARSFLHNDKGWFDALTTINVREVVTTKANQLGDNEYVNHVYFVGTLNKTGKYQYGTGHLSLLLHWIPRQVWPSKPSLGQGFFYDGQLFRDLNRHAGYGAFGGGAAAGGFADSFLQYGYATPLFWLLLGYHFGRRYSAAISNRAPQYLFSYVAILCSSHWLLSQGVAAAFVPCIIFIFVPIVVLRFAQIDLTSSEVEWLEEASDEAGPELQVQQSPLSTGDTL
ncbi:hypothetical protein [Novipirellula sp.]|uniref:hypothetical protein n=1 Tax=Novipirellula sp. TaxID=2795430 RepID=UPI0035629F47